MLLRNCICGYQDKIKQNCFYQFHDKWATEDAYNLVKADNVKYAYGPKLQVANTEADVMSDKVLATNSD
ncbi:hypothetical protein PT285_03285 [Lactobacillus sp. ESL0791]|uniref:hypothetical protein n=1 Tax=Lactobacillus sp. ESL0791 TaxID=2983234 RepID=UPI0023F8939B|nr:hypothetical protein [Lactobacillus sp. ESL0791]MDF7638458.1 hypothetical protein [Lactobacillus sp. ESL0791]